MGFLVSDLHLQASTGRGDRQVAITEASDDVERLARRLFEREPCRVVGDARFDRCAHLRRRTEEAIRWDEPADALMRPLEVVRVDVEPEAPLTVREIREDRPAQKLVPKRLPEALDLAERLRMLRSRLHVANPFAPQLLLELCLAAPRRVLPAVVGQKLARRAVVGDPAPERLHHELAPLVMRERERHEVA